MKARRFTTFAWISLGYTMFVVAWGALVRATGSGAGCGSHWPTCQGEVIPLAPTTATIIELTHRVTSSLALIIVIVQLVAALIIFPRGHLARRASGWSVFFMITEALIGAGLVLFEKVAHDKSIARGWWMSAHLLNTFTLLACLGLAVFASSREGTPMAKPRGRSWLMLASALGAVLVTGVTGAIAALGDTLFPATSLREGLVMDLSPQAHVFLQLRALHPFAAAITAVHLLVVASAFSRSGKDARTREAARRVGILVVLQIAVGVANLALAAPTAMQLVHLLVADVLWLALVALTASVASETSTLTGSDKSASAVPLHAAHP